MELPIMLFLGIQPTGGGKSISTAHRCGTKTNSFGNEENAYLKIALKLSNSHLGVQKYLRWLSKPVAFGDNFHLHSEFMHYNG